jgi:hypothetical protein
MVITVLVYGHMFRSHSVQILPLSVHFRFGQQAIRPATARRPLVAQAFLPVRFWSLRWGASVYFQPAEGSAEWPRQSLTSPVRMRPPAAPIEENSFIISTYRVRVAKPFRMRTYKIANRKSFRMRTYENEGEGVG